MATISATQARYHGNTRGLCRTPFGGPGIPGYVEAASQTYDAGDPVRPDGTSGKIEIIADGDALAALFGITAKDASGTTDEKCYGWFVQPHDLYVMNLESNGSGVATALAQVGDTVNFNVVSGKLLADVLPGGSAAVGTKPWGVIRAIYCTEHGYTDGDALGDTNGRVVVEIMSGIALGGSA